MIQEQTMVDTTTGPDLNGAATQEPKPVDVALADQVVNTKVTWDDSKMVTTFANVVNVLVTREELTLLFGMNQTWNASETKELTVQLTNRIVLTPYAAKRLLTLLTARMRDYETRIGPITL
jgi:Protein of unknown function (DUF3467)